MSDPPSSNDDIDTLARLAAERPPDDRAAFLKDLCPDEKTRRAVWERLYELFPQNNETDADGSSDEPSKGDAAPTDDLFSPPNQTPDRVGSWKIRTELGANTLGNTYLTEWDDDEPDNPIPHQAALFLARNSLDKRNQERARERFRDQIEIMEAFQHPNVVSLVDSGITGLDPDHGRAFCPYVVTEYVDGVPLDAYCNENGLGVEPRLRLFCQMCEAVDFSHRNLIVRYDPKPSDVLVIEPDNDPSADPQAKLHKIGVETALKEVRNKTSGLRRLEDLNLDIRYTSPELVEQDLVTTVTDVYSLGVVLCLLLTGSLPYGDFWKMSIPELAETIGSAAVSSPSELVPSDGEPYEVDASIEEAYGTSPRALRDTVEGDLDAIVMKALRKEPERRYRSAAALGRDVARYLDGRPVEARLDE